MYELPIEYSIGETIYNITNKGDYRMVLDCFKVLDDTSMDRQDRILSCLFIFYNNFTRLEDIAKLDENTITELITYMFNFMNCGDDNNSQGLQSNHKLIDWEKDSTLICSAVNKVAQTEIRSVPYIHWWTFMGYYLAIGECSFSEIVSIRSKIAKGQKLEKYEQKFKRENPQYFSWDFRATLQDNEANEYIKSIWNKT
jgi:hypothetical protein